MEMNVNNKAAWAVHLAAGLGNEEWEKVLSRDLTLFVTFLSRVQLSSSQSHQLVFQICAWKNFSVSLYVVYIALITTVLCTILSKTCFSSHFIFVTCLCCVV